VAQEVFFSELPECSRFEEVVHAGAYTDAPGSWYVVMSDVRGSTVAIEAGRYREVNALGVATIIAVCNALPDLEVPFVFGGDGATVLVPGSRLEAVSQALRGVRAIAVDAFDMELRIAAVSVAELAEAGYPVRVRRFRLSEHIALGMFAGEGIAVAERWVKHPETAERYAITPGEVRSDLEGFECRWQPMKSQRGEVVSLLVVALGDDVAKKERTYTQVMAELQVLLDGRDACPVSRHNLRLSGPLSDFSIEARLKTGDREGKTVTRARDDIRKRTLIGRVLAATRQEAGGFDGRGYMQEFIRNSDFRKFDETLRMVLDLTPVESQTLEDWLAARHSEGLLAYGLHRSDSAIATCMVKAYKGDHVHFIDGAGGGYAMAAKSLKAQLAQR
jgi:hypothetical protein